MQPIPNDILAQFDALMIKKEVPFSARPDYRKWLRFYLDFRSKYPLPDSRSEHVRLFIEKFQQKNQSPAQQKQAAYAASLFFERQRVLDDVSLNTHSNTETSATTPPPPLGICHTISIPGYPLYSEPNNKRGQKPAGFLRIIQTISSPQIHQQQN